MTAIRDHRYGRINSLQQLHEVRLRGLPPLSRPRFRSAHPASLGEACLAPTGIAARGRVCDSQRSFNPLPERGRVASLSEPGGGGRSMRQSLPAGTILPRGSTIVWETRGSQRSFNPLPERGRVASLSEPGGGSRGMRQSPSLAPTALGVVA